jgi:HlyD family secretion protein
VLGENDFVRPLNVTIGATDGTQSEVSGPDVKPGLRVVVGDQAEEEGGAPGSGPPGGDEDKGGNPFLPKIPKGSRPPPGPM